MNIELTPAERAILIAELETAQQRYKKGLVLLGPEDERWPAKTKLRQTYHELLVGVTNLRNRLTEGL